MGLAQTFGLNVRRLRHARGQSLEAFAHDVGLSTTYVGQLERGARNPSLGIVEQLAVALNVDPLTLLRRA